MPLNTKNVNLEDVFSELIKFRQRVADLERTVGGLTTKNSELEDANRVSTTRILELEDANRVSTTRILELEDANRVSTTRILELEDANRVSTTRILELEKSDRVKSKEIERLRTENTLLRNALVDTLVSRFFSDLKTSTIDTVVDMIAGSPLNTNVVVCDVSTPVSPECYKGIGLLPKTLFVIEHMLNDPQGTTTGSSVRERPVARNPTPAPSIETGVPLVSRLVEYSGNALPDVWLESSARGPTTGSAHWLTILYDARIRSVPLTCGAAHKRFIV
jgi:hypothetical protein